jgi:hypothetical protein
MASNTCMCAYTHVRSSACHLTHLRLAIVRAGGMTGGFLASVTGVPQRARALLSPEPSIWDSFGGGDHDGHGHQSDTLGGLELGCGNLDNYPMTPCGPGENPYTPI